MRHTNLMTLAVRRVFFIVMIPGSKGHKSDASLLAGGFLNLGPAKNMSKEPFFEKNERITNVFRIAGVQST